MVKRDEFVDRLAKKGYTKHDARIIMEDFLLTLEEAIVEGEDVLFRGFGTFKTVTTKPKVYTDYVTKEIKVAAPIRKPRFIPGKLLRREVLEGRLRDR